MFYANTWPACSKLPFTQSDKKRIATKTKTIDPTIRICVLLLPPPRHYYTNKNISESHVLNSFTS